MRSWKLLCFTACFVVTATNIEALGCPIRITDGDFVSTDWSQTVVVNFNSSAPNLSTSSSSVPTLGGNPGAFKSIVNNVAAITASGDNRVWNLQLCTSRVYDPAMLGAILTIDYSEDSRSLSSTQRSGLLLEQNGRLFVANFNRSLIVSSPVWATQTAIGLVSSDFSQICPSSNCGTMNGSFIELDNQVQPDFSASAPVIRFGFYRFNSTFATGYSTQCGIDNWSVTINKCEADFNCDGVVDFFDYLDFVQAFSNGC